MRSQTKSQVSTTKSAIRCTRCKSNRIQRDYDEAFAIIRLAGMRKLLCNDCGHVFNGFDPLGKVNRAPTKRDPNSTVRRRSPRFKAHLPTSIALIEGKAADNKVTYSAATYGHCEAINEHGMGLSLIGSRFDERELTNVGRLLLIRIRLPEATVEAVVSLRNHKRVVENNNRRWLLGVQVHQISDDDKENLIAYLKKRQFNEPLLTT